jgi:hypothetical protein
MHENIYCCSKALALLSAIPAIRRLGYLVKHTVYTLVTHKVAQQIFIHSKPFQLKQSNFTRFELMRDIQGIHKRMARFQKLTRNLFLTLHRHNVHRQQRQLSKFLMRDFTITIVFFNSAGSDVLQQETTTFSLGHPVCQI